MEDPVLFAFIAVCSNTRGEEGERERGREGERGREREKEGGREGEREREFIRFDN